MNEQEANERTSVQQDIVVFYAVKQSNLLLAAGVVFLVVIIFLMLSGATTTASIVPAVIIMIVMGVWWRRSPLIVFHHDHLVINRGPVRSRLTLLYSEISRVENKKGICTLYYRLHGNDTKAEKKARISLGSMRVEDRDRFELTLRHYVGEGMESQQAENV